MGKEKKDMYRHLKKKLVMMYWLTSTMILVCVILIILFYWVKRDRRNELTAFERAAENFAEQAQQAEGIKHSWVKQMESRNEWYLKFYENDVDLQLPDGSIEEESLDDLFSQLHAVVEDEQPLFFNVLYYNGMKSSGIHELSNSDGNIYYGKIYFMKFNTSNRKVLILHRITTTKAAVLRYVSVLMLCLLFGSLLLFIFSFCYVGYVVRPVEEANTKQKAFIASVSHELRTPLAVLQVGVGSLKKELDVMEDGTRLKRYLYPMEGECVRMNRLVEDMLLLAATDQKNWTIRTESVDIETLLIECYDSFCMMNQEHQNQIQIDLSEEVLPEIQGDTQRLKQVIMILLDNAMSYTNPEDGITLRAYAKDHEISIEVEDHGEGMSDAEKQKVFEQFYRRENSRNNRRHFGLGLSIAKRLVELHQGRIEVKDTKGQGTTFVVHLPV